MKGTAWEAYAAGRVLVGQSATDSDFTAGKTGGEKTHKLTVSEMPRHGHAQNVSANPGTGSSARIDYDQDGRGAPFSQGIETDTRGNDAPHNNLQPYIAVYIWRRTA